MVETKTITLSILLAIIATTGIVYVNLDTEKIYKCPTDERFAQCDSISGTGNTRCYFSENEQGRTYTTCSVAWEKYVVDRENCENDYEQNKGDINQFIYNLNTQKYKSYDDIMYDKMMLNLLTDCNVLLKTNNDNLTTLIEIREELLSRNIMPGEQPDKNQKIVFPKYE